MSELTSFSQYEYLIGFEWGDTAAKESAAMKRVTVIVDTLDFSSAVVTAVDKGATVFPAKDEEQAKRIAKKNDAQTVKKKDEALREGGFSLSPLSMEKATSKDKIVVYSPNGAHETSSGGRGSRLLLVGTFLNRIAVSKLIRRIVLTHSIGCTIIACGERWKGKKEFRPDIEDFIAASAILNSIALPGAYSPEAKVCASVWNTLSEKYQSLLEHCGSGKKTAEEGFACDIRFACQLDHIDTVPVLTNGSFERIDPDTLCDGELNKLITAPCC
jgi:2-phosphosulfolactate phosphatase